MDLKNNQQIRWVINCFQILLGILAFYFLIGLSGLNFSILFKTIKESSLLFLIIGMLFYIISTFVSALRYSIFLSNIVPIPYLVSLTLFQNLLLTIIPWRIGEFGFPILLRRDFRVQISMSVGIILLIRAIDFLILIFFMVIVGGYITPSIFFLLSFVIIILSGLVFLGRRILPLLYYSSLFINAKDLMNDLRGIFEPKKIVILLFQSIIYFLITSIQSLFILNAFSLNINFTETIYLNVITSLSSILPIHPPGGWGTIDSIQVFSLSRMGFDPEFAIPIIVSAHMFYTLIILIGGVIGWVSLKTKHQESNLGTTI